jgi:hypothetical protein
MMLDSAYDLTDLADMHLPARTFYFFSFSGTRLRAAVEAFVH